MDVHGANACPHEMVGATGAKVGQGRRVLSIDELENFVRVIVMANGAPAGGQFAAQKRQNLNHNLASVLTPVELPAAEKLFTAFLLMLNHEHAEIINHRQAVQVTLMRGLAPGKQAVAAQHNAVAAGIRFHGFHQAQGQIKSRPLPGKPHQVVVEALVEFLHLLFAVGRGSQGDSPVGVQVVNVRERQKRVQRSVNRRRHRRLSERRLRIVRHHLVFVFAAAINALQIVKAVEIKKRKAFLRRRAQVAAAAFDAQHPHGLAGEGVGKLKLRAGVTPSEIRNTQVRAEKVGAVTQQLVLIVLPRLGLSLVPKVLQILHR